MTLPPPGAGREPWGARWRDGEACGNAGGVAVSGREMSQNAVRLEWSRDEGEWWLQSRMHASMAPASRTAKFGAA